MVNQLSIWDGSPDILPPKKISESLEKSLNHKNAHRYQSYKGTDLLRESIKNFINLIIMLN